MRDQRRLLALAAQFVRPGGRCVYATCSLTRGENQDVVASLLSRRGQFELRREELIRPAGADDPARWSDGGYFAVLRR